MKLQVVVEAMQYLNISHFWFGRQGRWFFMTKFGRYARRKLLISFLHSMLAFVKASTTSKNLKKK